MNKIKNQRAKSAARKPFAKKSFGQNFLVDPNYIEKIITALNPRENETILEIGPGRGALTEKLVDRAQKVIAIELDKDLIPFLQDKFSQNENFHLIEADALNIDFSELAKQHGQASKLKLVANLPYNISTAILQNLIEGREVFSEMVLMFQREVVERITAAAGSSERGFLTVLVEAFLEAEKLFDIPPAAFRPAPKIWSSVVRITPKIEAEIQNTDLFRQLASAGFQQKRKTIFNNLKNVPSRLSAEFEKNGGLHNILSVSGIDASRRAETLTIGEWKKLFEKITGKN